MSEGKSPETLIKELLVIQSKILKISGICGNSDNHLSADVLEEAKEILLKLHKRQIDLINELQMLKIL